MASLARRLLGDCRCVLSALRPRTLSSGSSSSGIIRPAARAIEAAGQPQQQQQQQQRIIAAAAGFSTKAAGGGKKGKKDDAGGGGGGDGGAPVGDISKVSPVNIYKDGTDPPLLPDDQYPEWLFHIRPLTLPEYRKMDLSKLPLKEQRRYWKLLNRQVIKEKNAAGQKL